MTSAEKSFAAQKFSWIESVSGDRRLSHLASRLGVWLATKYVNKKKGYGYPDQEALAKDLGVSSRSIRRASKELETAGYFAVNRHAFTQAHNQYYPIPLSESPPMAAEMDTDVRPTGHHCPPRPDMDVRSYRTPVSALTNPVNTNPENNNPSEDVLFEKEEAAHNRSQAGNRNGTQAENKTETSISYGRNLRGGPPEFRPPPQSPGSAGAVLVMDEPGIYRIVRSQSAVAEQVLQRRQEEVRQQNEKDGLNW